MIYKFTPLTGRKAGVDYFFPYVQSDSRVNNRTSSLQPIPFTTGMFDPNGVGPMPMTDGQFTVSLILSPTWYASNDNWNYYNGSSNDFTARENAILDLMCSLVEGGEGRLVDYMGLPTSPWAGVVDPVTRAPITYLWAQAKVSGSVTVTRTSTISTAEVAWSVLSGLWKSDSGQEYVFS